MKLKFFKASDLKQDKNKLRKIALREALAELVLNDVYPSYQTAYKNIMDRAKTIAGYKSKKQAG